MQRDGGRGGGEEGDDFGGLRGLVGGEGAAGCGCGGGLGVHGAGEVQFFGGGAEAGDLVGGAEPFDEAAGFFRHAGFVEGDEAGEEFGFRQVGLPAIVPAKYLDDR